MYTQIHGQLLLCYKPYFNLLAWTQQSMNTVRIDYLWPPDLLSWVAPFQLCWAPTQGQWKVRVRGTCMVAMPMHGNFKPRQTSTNKYMHKYICPTATSLLFFHVHIMFDYGGGVGECKQSEAVECTTQQKVNIQHSQTHYIKIHVYWLCSDCHTYGKILWVACQSFPFTALICFVLTFFFSFWWKVKETQAFSTSLFVPIPPKHYKCEPSSSLCAKLKKERLPVVFQ